MTDPDSISPENALAALDGYRYLRDTLTGAPTVVHTDNSLTQLKRLCEGVAGVAVAMLVAKTRVMHDMDQDDAVRALVAELDDYIANTTLAMLDDGRFPPEAPPGAVPGET